MSWSRGPVCGVDNCPTTLWRELDGQTLCKFGHVRAFQFTYEDEADDQVIGRRVTVGKQPAKAAKELNHWYGPKLLALSMQCSQQLLRNYTNWIKVKLGLDWKFEREVRVMWTKLLKYTQFAHTSFEFDDGTSSKDASGELTPGTTFTSDPLTCLCLVHVVLLRGNYHTSLSEIYEWIRTFDLPYIQHISAVMPAAATVHLPVASLRQLSPRNLPKLEKMMEATMKLARLLWFQEDIKLPEMRVQPMVMEAVTRLMLPSEVVSLALELLQVLGEGPTMVIPTVQVQVSQFPTLNVLSAVIVATKMSYYKYWVSYDKVSSSPYWALWSEIIQRFYEQYDTTMDVDVPVWSDAKSEHYMDISETFLVEPEPTTSNRRLMGIFPYTPVKKQDVTISELLSVLNRQLTPPPASPPKEYLSFNDFTKLDVPPIYKTALEGACAAYGLSPSILNAAVRRVEKTLHRLRKPGNPKHTTTQPHST